MSRKVLIVNHRGKLDKNITAFIYADRLEAMQVESFGISLRTHSILFLVDKVLMYNGKPSQHLHDEGKMTDTNGQVHEYKWVSIRDNINDILDFLQHDEG